MLNRKTSNWNHRLNDYTFLDSPHLGFKNRRRRGLLLAQSATKRHPGNCKSPGRIRLGCGSPVPCHAMPCHATGPGTERSALLRPFLKWPACIWQTMILIMTWAAFRNSYCWNSCTNSRAWPWHGGGPREVAARNSTLSKAQD